MSCEREMSVWSMEISAPQESDSPQNFSPPRRFPLGIPIKIAITEKIESARGMMGRGKRRELLLFSFPFPSCPARSLFLSPQPPRNTKRPMRQWNLGSGFQSLMHGIPDSSSCITDFKAQDS